MVGCSPAPAEQASQGRRDDEAVVRAEAWMREGGWESGNTRGSECGGMHSAAANEDTLLRSDEWGND